MSQIFIPDHRRVRDEGFSEGARYMRDQIERTFMQWASTHPDPVVRDELWAYTDKLRAFKLRKGEDSE